MKNLLNNPLALLFSLLFILGSFTTYSIAQVPKHEMQIKGTSNLHDWTCEVTTIQVTLDAAFDDDGIQKINDLKIRIPVKSIKSGKKIMDGKLYDAMKAEQNPHIEFEFIRQTQLTGKEVSIVGQMHIAGESKLVEVSAQFRKGEGMYFLQGTCPINMNDFKVEPPTAMMGALKTGPEIVVEFKINVEQTQLDLIN